MPNLTSFRHVPDLASATAAAFTMKAAFTKAPVEKSLLAGTASVAAGTVDLVQLIRKGDTVSIGHGATRGIGSAAQVIGGFMMMSKTGNPDAKMVAATLAISGSLAKATDTYLPYASCGYLNGAIKGAIVGSSVSMIVQGMDGRLGGWSAFNPRAVAVTGTIGAVIGIIATAIDKTDSEQQAAAAAAKANRKSPSVD